MGFPGVNLSLVAPGFEMVAYLKNSGSTLVEGCKMESSSLKNRDRYPTYPA